VSISHGKYFSCSQKFIGHSPLKITLNQLFPNNKNFSLGQDTANAMGMDYIETSAYTNQNVANAVVFTLRKIMELTKKGYI
jgi:hypothetical protein